MTQMNRTKSIFTFGQSHMTNFPMPHGGRIADYCPRPNQFVMEYDESRFNEEYFPGGELCRITEEGIA